MGVIIDCDSKQSQPIDIAIDQRQRKETSTDVSGKLEDSVHGHILPSRPRPCHPSGGNPTGSAAAL